MAAAERRNQDQKGNGSVSPAWHRGDVIAKASNGEPEGQDLLDVRKPRALGHLRCDALGQRPHVEDVVAAVVEQLLQRACLASAVTIPEVHSLVTVDLLQVSGANDAQSSLDQLEPSAIPEVSQGISQIEVRRGRKAWKPPLQKGQIELRAVEGDDEWVVCRDARKLLKVLTLDETVERPPGVEPNDRDLVKVVTQSRGLNIDEGGLSGKLAIHPPLVSGLESTGKKTDVAARQRAAGFFKYRCQAAQVAERKLSVAMLRQKVIPRVKSGGPQLAFGGRSDTLGVNERVLEHVG